jgi:hypothetical protein
MRLPDVLTPVGRLRVIKTVHTIVWAFFVACIAAVPLSAWKGRFGVALLFIGVVTVEVVVIVVNRWQCPLTPLAARYTGDRHANFDIYLPEWLARYNKEIFGSLFALGVVFTLIRWLRP